VTIPKSDTLMLPLLRFAGSRKFRNTDATEFLVAEFRLSPEDRAELLPNGRNKFANLVHWASGQLGMAELLKNQDGVYEITERGRKVLVDPPIDTPP
jgi:restriction system protein